MHQASKVASFLRAKPWVGFYEIGIHDIAKFHIDHRRHSWRVLRFGLLASHALPFFPGDRK
jgi:hypothetical protein